MTLQHDRTLDHYGYEDTLTTVLSEAVGRYPAGETLQDVLADMAFRLAFIEGVGCDTHLYSFTGDALILSVRSATFTADASILGPHLFADAVIIKPTTVTMTANAVIIEDVIC